MITLLITTYNRGDLLSRSLARLADLTLPDQLVVVNDGGEDDCSKAVADWAVQTGVDAGVFYLDNPGRTMCSKARNYGLRFCEGDFVLTSEPEVFFKSDVVDQLTDPDSAAMQVAGTVFYAPGDWDGNYGTPGEQHMGHQGWIAPYMTLWPREALEEIGGWDEDFPAPWGGDDIDIIRRLEEFGLVRYQRAELEVIHVDHGGADVALNTMQGQSNSKYLYAKPYFHGDSRHQCSWECKVARGVIIPRRFPPKG